jgi:hypothetical protein
VSKAIFHEEFISKVPEVIESLLDKGETLLNVIASDVPLDNADVIFKLSKKIDNGIYYFYRNIEVWFCPTFWMYFKRPAPFSIWIKKI